MQRSAVTSVRDLFPLNIVLSGDMFISFEREHRVWKYASTGNATFGLNPETTDLWDIQISHKTSKYRETHDVFLSASSRNFAQGHIQHLAGRVRIQRSPWQKVTSNNWQPKNWAYSLRKRSFRPWNVPQQDFTNGPTLEQCCPVDVATNAFSFSHFGLRNEPLWSCLQMRFSRACTYLLLCCALMRYHNSQCLWVMSLDSALLVQWHGRSKCTIQDMPGWVTVSFIQELGGWDVVSSLSPAIQPITCSALGQGKAKYFIVMGQGYMWHLHRDCAVRHVCRSCNKLCHCAIQSPISSKPLDCIDTDILNAVALYSHRYPGCVSNSWSTSCVQTVCFYYTWQIHRNMPWRSCSRVNFGTAPIRIMHMSGFCAVCPMSNRIQNRFSISKETHRPSVVCKRVKADKCFYAISGCGWQVCEHDIWLWLTRACARFRFSWKSSKIMGASRRWRDCQMAGERGCKSLVTQCWSIEVASKLHFTCFLCVSVLACQRNLVDKFSWLTTWCAALLKGSDVSPVVKEFQVKEIRTHSSRCTYFGWISNKYKAFCNVIRKCCIISGCISQQCNAVAYHDSKLLYDSAAKSKKGLQSVKSRYSRIEVLLLIEMVGAFDIWQAAHGV